MYISKTKLVITGILVASLIVIVTSYSQNKLTQGQQPYIPAQLEWLELKLNAKYRNLMQDEHGFIVEFKAIPEANTIYILIWYDFQIWGGPNLRDIFVPAVTNDFKKLVSEEIKEMGWNEWCRVETKLSPYGQKISIRPTLNERPVIEFTISRSMEEADIWKVIKNNLNQND